MNIGAGLRLLTWVGLIICSVATASAQAPPAMEVRFPGAPGAPALRGHLHRPEGDGPFPAVVLLHGCGGLTSTSHWWAETLRSWGYVALLVDSFNAPLLILIGEENDWTPAAR